ncbi:PEP-CTERM sorting domain-containing protein [Marinobacter sp. 71-i]|uniref:PEP-CTERM sorting domain-containing protein n=1 Tax=Marinobacter iranensis TaxID=2962607 RepID=A0ABT5YD85_9GAMM|nr:PEP-CTERM sorting domain-containing protein [Marinobacter iranensis]MDF0751534.1 PEP-CTERM sorting domain-containing protein [Marinobacter iranensis]
MQRFVPNIILLSFFVSASASASSITGVDLGALDVGAKIVGPVGPDVEVSLINADGDSVGDLRSSVSCPSGFTKCTPSSNSPGTIYTYSHTVIPGVDQPNDAPFPKPSTVLGFDDVGTFSLGFAAEGFNGVAGYDFGEADAAGVGFTIELADSGELVWMTDSEGWDWDTGEPITFFWQTTRPPAGPGGVYSISNATGDGTGNGPVPAAKEVPESATALLLVTGLAWIGYRRKLAAMN